MHRLLTLFDSPLLPWIIAAAAGFALAAAGVPGLRAL